MTDGKLQWHPAFVAALHIEFEKESENLEIEQEHLLSKKPMQIDVVVIKKSGNIPIQKNIGQIFRKYNIIEYKSPEDCLSLNDFYKVYGYTCFYQSETEHVAQILPEELTITFVCNHYPRKLLKRLSAKRKLTTIQKAAGIYHLTGDEFPIQIIVTRELSEEENYWLQHLRNDLQTGSEIQDLLENYEKNKNNLYYQALMDLIIRANQEQMKEEAVMCDALNELLAEIFAEKLEKETNEAIERGISQGIKQGIRQGIEQGESRTKTIFKLSAAGTPIDLIAQKCGVTVEKVQQILE